MPNYDYCCDSCEHTWDDIFPISKRDTPTKKPCPECSENTVRRGWVTAPVGGVDANLTPDKATGGQWSELMNKMRKSPVIDRKSKVNLDIASSRTGARYGAQ